MIQYRASGMIVRTKGIIAALALLAGVGMFAFPALAEGLNPGLLCSSTGGEWNEETSTCSFAVAILCTVYAQLADAGITISMPGDCSGEPTPEEQCEQDGGTWNTGTEECDIPPTPQEECEAGGGIWNAENSTCTPAESSDGGGGTQEQSGSGHSSGGGGKPQSFADNKKKDLGGVVLGAVTECSEPLLTTYLGMGRQNNIAEVVKLQMFLNAHLGLSLPITGIFGTDTKAAVEQFQLKYADEVLAPWVPFGLTSKTTPTGYVYKTTQRMINKLHCASLDIPMPVLP